MTNCFAILGSGFGLYGYLPALVDKIAQAIVLPETYYEKVMSRKELSPYLPYIRWVKNIDQGLEIAGGVAIASTPIEQIKIVNKCLNYKNIKYFFIEKPLAPNVDEARALLKLLINSNVKFRIGYTFLYTEWHEHLKKILQKKGQQNLLLIDWEFHAHHFSENVNTWKRFDQEGGGVFKFYGVHILALLADLGYEQIKDSHVSARNSRESESWQATFRGNHLPDCRVNVNSRGVKNVFRIKDAIDSETYVDLTDPFETKNFEQKNNDDRRVSILRKLCNSIEFGDQAIYDLYAKVNNLWKNTETETLITSTRRMNDAKDNLDYKPLL